MKPLYIFDLDGTLALIEHRRHFVTNGNHDWDSFHAACVGDKPNKAIISICEELTWKADVWIWSGRSDIVKPQTEEWLEDHLDGPYMQLMMRPHGNYIADDKLKFEWYDAMTSGDKNRLVATFDDRDRMVQMWRDNGITCLQVAPGDF